jgi:hypothetical protein
MPHGSASGWRPAGSPPAADSDGRGDETAGPAGVGASAPWAARRTKQTWPRRGSWPAANMHDDVRHDEEQDRRQRHAREHGSTPSERCRQLEGKTLPAAGAVDVQEVRATRDGLERGHLRGSLGQLELVEHHLALGQQPAGAPECGTCEVWSSS